MASGNPSSESPFPLLPDGADPGGEPPASPAEPSGEITAEVALQFAGLVFSRPEQDPPAVDLRSTPGTEAERPRPASPALSWPIVILGSYASAVTLALVWVLATGKTLPKFQARTTTRAPEARATAAPSASAPAPAASPTPPDGAVALGGRLVVGELEVRPLTILHKTVRVSSPFGLDGPSWENPDCLVLTLRLKNASKDRAMTPLEPPTSGSGGAVEGSRVELGTNRRLSMLGLDLEGDWVIDEQSFPTIAPGATADIVLVSEPVPLERVAGPSMWWVELNAGGERKETIGVRFSRGDVDEVGG